MTSGPWISITGQSLDLDLPDGYLGKCTSVSAFEKLNRLGEGTYGVVSRARHRDTSEIVALKQVRIEPEERQNGIPITALREIAILRSLKHANIINVTDVAVGSGDDSNGADTLDEVYMVMEYAEQVGAPTLEA
ncbi:MAG: Cyclin-dependent kinase 10 [Vezdaea acicularis]|nr:MAG: Cyclin-dependent kinase 10 [Vezdaea acicularis]